MDKAALMKVFMTEADEHLSACRLALDQMASGSGSQSSDEVHSSSERMWKTMEQIFRSAHTLGTSATSMGFCKLGGLAKELEKRMNRIKTDQRGLTPEMVAALRLCHEAVERLLDEIREGKDKGVDIQPAVDAMEKWL